MTKELTDIFGNTVKIRIIEYYLNNPKAMHNITSLSIILGSSYGTVRTSLKGLCSSGILKCLYMGKSLVIVLNEKSQITKDLILFLEGEKCKK